MTILDLAAATLKCIVFFSCVLFLQKIEYDISCKLSPKEIICMKCHTLFSWDNKKNIINFSYADFALRVFKVKGYFG